MSGGQVCKSRKFVEGLIVGVLVIVVAAIAVPKDSSAHDAQSLGAPAHDVQSHGSDDQGGGSHH